MAPKPTGRITPAQFLAAWQTVFVLNFKQKSSWGQNQASSFIRWTVITVTALRGKEYLEAYRLLAFYLPQLDVMLDK